MLLFVVEDLIHLKNLWYLYKFLTLNLQIQVIINQKYGKIINVNGVL